MALLALPLLGTARSARAEITFSAPTSYNAGSAPQAIATGDLNRDGLPDLVTANYSSATVSVFLNNPLQRGTFLKGVEYPVANGPMSLVVADLNGDGAPDIAAACFAASSVTVLTNLGGTGVFAPAGTFAAGVQPSSIAAGALRRNAGAPVDLFVTNVAAATLTVLQGTGAGTFAASGVYPVASLPKAVTAGDFNSDGNLDVAVGGASDSTVSILQGDGAGSLRSVSSIKLTGHPYGLTAVRLNPNGPLDLVAANYSKGGVIVMKGHGDGSFDPAVYSLGGLGSCAIGVGDFNRDGAPDLAVSNSFSKDAGVFAGNGQSFALASTVGAGLAVIRNGIAVADLNGDGLFDIATSNSNNTVDVFLNSSVFVGAFTLADSTEPAGMATRATISLTGPAPSGGTVIPVSVDGSTTDPVATAPPTVTIPEGQASITFDVVGWREGTANITASINGQPRTVTLNVGPPPTGDTKPELKGDVDGDGRVTINDAVMLLREANGDGEAGS
jgi:hypothetical protein